MTIGCFCRDQLPSLWIKPKRVGQSCDVISMSPHVMHANVMSCHWCVVVSGSVIVVSVALLSKTSFKGPSWLMILGVILLNMLEITAVIVIHCVKTSSTSEFPITLWVCCCNTLPSCREKGLPRKCPKDPKQYGSEPSSRTFLPTPSESCRF